MLKKYEYWNLQIMLKSRELALSHVLSEFLYEYTYDEEASVHLCVHTSKTKTEATVQDTGNSSTEE